MRVKIQLGEYSGKTIDAASLIKTEDVLDTTIANMDKLLLSKDVTIENVDQFLLIHANTLILRFIVKDSIDKEDEWNILGKPMIDPKTIKISEVLDDGTEIIIQNEDGLVNNNYFNRLVGALMDLFYDALMYYKPKN